MHVGSDSMHILVVHEQLMPSCNDRDDGSITHEVLESEGDLGSGDMLADADRTPTSEG